MLFATEFVSLTVHLFYDRENLVHDWLYFFIEPKGAPIIHDQEKNKVVASCLAVWYTSFTFLSLINC